MGLNIHRCVYMSLSPQRQSVRSAQVPRVDSSNYTNVAFKGLIIPGNYNNSGSHRVWSTSYVLGSEIKVYVHYHILFLPQPYKPSVLLSQFNR